MATNRKRRVRTREGIDLDESIEKFLLTGQAELGTPGRALRVSRFFDQGERIRLAWEQHRDYLLQKWKSKKRYGTPWGEIFMNDPRAALYG